MFEKLVSWMFGIDRQVEHQRIPSSGEVWRMDGEETPWGSTPYIDVTILDVKDGWVRYDMGNGNGFLFRDERKELKSFVRMYKPAKR